MTSQCWSAEGVVQELDEHVAARQECALGDEVHSRCADGALSDEVARHDDCVTRMGVFDQPRKATGETGLAEMSVLDLDGQDAVTACHNEVDLVRGPLGTPVMQFIRHRQDLEELLEYDLLNDVTSVDSAVQGGKAGHRAVPHAAVHEVSLRRLAQSSQLVA